MKYIKTYEEIGQPEVGDYVLISADSGNKQYNDFINNTIGKIYRKRKDFIHIKYDSVPYGIRTWFTNGDRDGAELKDVVFFSKTKEEIESKMTGQKYNL